jgi:hypothetical protein
LHIPPVVHFDSAGNIYDSYFLSDKNGNFNASSTMKRMIVGLPKYRIRITKNGYRVLDFIIDLKAKTGSGIFRLLEN